MKAAIGILLMLSGLALGAYVGVWVCFIGGIVGAIEQIQAEHINALQVAINVAKIFGAGLAGALSAICLIVPGRAMLS